MRQAANYSVDAYSIVKNIFDGLGFVVEGAAGKQHIGYDPNAKRYPYDPKKARELLAKAGYPDGVNVKMYYSAGRYPKDTEVVQAIAAQMKKGGFNIELITQEWVVFWGKSGVNGGKMPFYYISRGSVVDAHTHLEQYFKTGASVRVDYSNPEFDRIMALEQAETDAEKRQQAAAPVGPDREGGLAVGAVVGSGGHLRRRQQHRVEASFRRENPRLGDADQVATKSSSTVGRSRVSAPWFRVAPMRVW